MRFVDKNIAILGMGEEGRDVFSWLKDHCRRCRVEVFDKVKMANLDRFDVIFRSPGFWRLSPMLKNAEKHGALITSAAKLFFQLCPAEIIGVTGTKGKGTTTALIYEILKAAGKRVFIGGNMGKPMLKLLPRLKKNDWVCLELSSFQLQDLSVSPHIAVVLAITSDHLDVHKSVSEYRRAKANLWRWQNQEDFCVTNARSIFTKAKIIPFSIFDLNLDLSKIKLLGRHNLENLAAAAAAAKLTGADSQVIERAAYGFSGLEHRLELVEEIGRVKYYNDSASTAPETAIAAIRSFARPLTLILGGSDKGADYRRLGREILESSHVKNLILIGQMAQKIKTAVKGFSGAVITGLTDMEAMVKTAKKISPAGSVVLLSPACASFDMFKNYRDRGEQFKLWVKRLSLE